jgi:signal transduction histidine kinase
LPALVVGVSVIGSVVRQNVTALIEARIEVAEAVAAAGAAEERARLARDMHDSVGKSLHGISLGAKALRRAIGRDPVLAGELATSVAESADQAAVEARTLLMSLRRGQDDRPTVEVVSEVIERWRQDTGIAARLSAVRVVDAAPAVTGQLQLALSEILHNIAKHAQASQVDIVLAGGPDTIELDVTDDGVGFDPALLRSREAAGHFGLRGLRERAEQLGGTAAIESQPGKGTCVRWTASRHPETS